MQGNNVACHGWQIELFEVNEDNDPPHRFLKDVEGTTILWEETILQLSKFFLLFNGTHIGRGDEKVS